MSEKLKTKIDPEVELIFTKLMKKGMDSNIFISDEVKKALETLCQNCSDSKIVPLLITQHCKAI